MSKTALVLSGGGGKGAFQVGAEAYCRLEKGMSWDLIAGVSIGSLNGSFISMGDHDALRELWYNVTPDLVYGPRRKWRIAQRLYRGRRSLFPLTGIGRVADMVDPARMKIPMSVGAVSLITGEFKMFDQSYPAYRKAMMASCALPLVFPPVDVDEDNLSMVDGGIRNLTPISAVLPALPDRIIVISCYSRNALPIPSPPKSALASIQRALDISMQEISHKDIDKTLRVNRLVAQAAASGNVLCNSEGRAFRHFDVTVIEPDFWIGDESDYTSQRARENYDLGWEAARKALA